MEWFDTNSICSNSDVELFLLIKMQAAKEALLQARQQELEKMTATTKDLQVR